MTTSFLPLFHTSFFADACHTGGLFLFCMGYGAVGAVRVKSIAAR